MTPLSTLNLSTLQTATPDLAPADSQAHTAVERANSSATSPVGSGRIEGGWEYVSAAYGLTTIALIAYAASLMYRRTRKTTVGPS